MLIFEVRVQSLLTWCQNGSTELFCKKYIFIRYMTPLMFLFLTFLFSEELLCCFYQLVKVPHWCIRNWQEPIARSVQLSHIPATAFSQTESILSLNLPRAQNPAETRASSSKHGLNFNWRRHFTGRWKKNNNNNNLRPPFPSLPMHAYVDWNEPISRGKI